MGSPVCTLLSDSLEVLFGPTCILISSWSATYSLYCSKFSYFGTWAHWDCNWIVLEVNITSRISFFGENTLSESVIICNVVILVSCDVNFSVSEESPDVSISSVS